MPYIANSDLMQEGISIFSILEVTVESGLRILKLVMQKWYMR